MINPKLILGFKRKSAEMLWVGIRVAMDSAINNRALSWCFGFNTSFRMKKRCFPNKQRMQIMQIGALVNSV